MGTITPVSGFLILEPIMASEEFKNHLDTKIKGFQFKTEKDYEGIPKTGIIEALPEDYEGPLKVGNKVVFTENSPSGFKLDGKTLMRIELDKIAGTVDE